jgi:hypothetical protein
MYRCSILNDGIHPIFDLFELLRCQRSIVSKIESKAIGLNQGTSLSNMITQYVPQSSVSARSMGLLHLSAEIKNETHEH